jgi:hypothetical protein
MGRYEDTCAALGLCIAANVPVVLWGPPGQGKTSVVDQLARDQGLRLETVIASIREPSDFAGLPVVDAAGGVRLAAPRWALGLTETGSGIVFFDELSTAPPAVQAAMLRVVVDRVVGDLALPPEVRVVAAANPPGLATDGWDLAPPMANRFCHLEWSLPAATLRDGFAYGWSRVDVPVVTPAAVAAEFDAAKRLVGAFLGSRPELATRLPASAAEAGFAFPTPRSWEMAARLTAAGRAAGTTTAVLNLLLAGCVGTAAAIELATYVDRLDLPDPESLLENPDSYPFRADRGDVVYAVAASVWAATLADPTAERWRACGRVLARIADAGLADIAFGTGRRWIDARPEGALPDTASLQSLAPILRELGRFADQRAG